MAWFWYKKNDDKEKQLNTDIYTAMPKLQQFYCTTISSSVVPRQLIVHEGYGCIQQKRRVYLKITRPTLFSFSALFILSPPYNSPSARRCKPGSCRRKYY